MGLEQDLVCVVRNSINPVPISPVSVDSWIAIPSKSSVDPFGKLLENLTKLSGEISLDLSVRMFPSTKRMFVKAPVGFGQSPFP